MSSPICQRVVPPGTKRRIVGTVTANNSEANRQPADRLSALVGERLWRERRVRGLSRKVVASQLEWSPKTLERTEHGRRELTAREIDQIAAWMNTTPAELVAD